MSLLCTSYNSEGEKYLFLFSSFVATLAMLALKLHEYSQAPHSDSSFNCCFQEQDCIISFLLVNKVLTIEHMKMSIPYTLFICFLFCIGVHLLLVARVIFLKRNYKIRLLLNTWSRNIALISKRDKYLFYYLILLKILHCNTVGISYILRRAS